MAISRFFVDKNVIVTWSLALFKVKMDEENLFKLKLQTASHGNEGSLQCEFS